MAKRRSDADIWPIYWKQSCTPSLNRPAPDTTNRLSSSRPGGPEQANHVDGKSPIRDCQVMSVATIDILSAREPLETWPRGGEVLRAVHLAILHRLADGGLREVRCLHLNAVRASKDFSGRLFSFLERSFSGPSQKKMKGVYQMGFRD